MAAASKIDISKWFDYGVKEKKAYMLIVCDTYEPDDYPVYVDKAEVFDEVYKRYDNVNMQKVMEVYDLAMDKVKQLAEDRSFHKPMSEEQRNEQLLQKYLKKAYDIGVHSPNKLCLKVIAATLEALMEEAKEKDSFILTFVPLSQKFAEGFNSVKS